MKINVLQDRGWLFLKNENRKMIIGLYCLPMVSLGEFIFSIDAGTKCDTAYGAVYL